MNVSFKTRELWKSHVTYTIRTLHIIVNRSTSFHMKPYKFDFLSFIIELFVPSFHVLEV